MTLLLSPNDLAGEKARKVRDVFTSGGVIAFPTETFYALCVDPYNTNALKRLFSLKGRSFANPVALIVKDRASAAALWAEVVQAAELLMAAFWPGPLTIVNKAGGAALPELVTAGTGKVGVRVSSSRVATGLAEVLDSPLTGTSANPTGSPPAKDSGEVLAYFDGRIDIIIDGGRLTTADASTVVDLSEGQVVVIRRGAVSDEKIMSIIKQNKTEEER